MYPEDQGTSRAYVILEFGLRKGRIEYVLQESKRNSDTILIGILW